jgi:uncharacterized protein
MSLITLFREYNELPEYSGLRLMHVNQLSLFGDAPIHIAATRGNLLELQLLYENGANLNLKGEHGYTPLHCAVEQGHLDAVNWLVSSHANVNLKNDDNQSPFDLACTLGYEAIQKVFNQ